MTPEKEAKIRELARLYGAAKTAWDSCGYVNMLGKTHEEILQCYEVCAVLERKMVEARVLLREEIEGHDVLNAAKGSSDE